MKIIPRDAEGHVLLTVAVDDATAAWLVEVADMSHARAEDVAASLLKDIADDDRQAHFDAPVLRIVGGTETQH